MMGNKTLAEIRGELKAAIEKTGQDPLEWFREQTAKARNDGHGTAVLESLQRLLAAGQAQRKRRKKTPA